MELTEEQKIEISDYIVTVPKYRETYNELYDHILNALEENEASFSIEEVIKVVNKDFGGFSEIVYQEKIYQQQQHKRFSRLFLLEMLNTFKWPEIINNLCLVALCLIFYNYNKNAPSNLKLILLSSGICFVGVGIFGYAKIYINKRKYSKYSILDNYMGYECSSGVVMMNIVLHTFIGKDNFFDLSESGKSIAILFLFFFCSIYVRTFIKFYNQRFKILTI